MATKRRRPNIRLWGAAEIGRAMGGLSRTRIYQLTQRKGFPEPLAELGMGNVWWADEVEDWIAEYRKTIAEEPEAE